MAEDQRPAEQRVDDDPGDADASDQPGRSTAERKLRIAWNSSQGSSVHI